MTNETISKISQMETKKLVITGIAVIFVLGLVSYAVALYAPQVSTAVGKVFSKSNETPASNISFKENVTNESDNATQSPKVVKRKTPDLPMCRPDVRTPCTNETSETVSRITPEEARKSFERDKQYYGEPGYV